MKRPIVIVLRLFVSAVALPFLAAQLTAQQHGTSTQPDPKAAARKAMLQDLDTQLNRIDEFLGNAPSPREKSAAKARVDKLKERRAALNKNFAQAPFEALKADVKAEHDKLVLWPKKAG